MRIVGIDPGLANTAIAVIDGPADEDVAALEYIGTAPNKSMRTATDDMRRTAEVIREVHSFLATLDPRPTVVVVEWYAPRFPQKRGWTTSIIVGAVAAVCWCLGLKCRGAKPPLHIQVSDPPPAFELSAKSRPHILDALTHARLEWHRREAERNDK